MSDIVVADLIRVYKMGKVEVIALRGLDATFPGGKVTWIRGPSGCGKTTLLNLVGGVDRPTAGSITMDGANLAHLSAAGGGPGRGGEGAARGRGPHGEGGPDARRTEWRGAATSRGGGRPRERSA